MPHGHEILNSERWMEDDKFRWHRRQHFALSAMHFVEDDPLTISETKQTIYWKN